jgi:hypothetical protein
MVYDVARSAHYGTQFHPNFLEKWAVEEVFTVLRRMALTMIVSAARGLHGTRTMSQSPHTRQGGLFVLFVNVDGSVVQEFFVVAIDGVALVHEYISVH